MRSLSQVYTGAARSPDQSEAGLGVWWGEDHPLNLSRRVEGENQTNEKAEIQAAIAAIIQARSEGVEKLEINTSSGYLIECITKNVGNWKKKG